MIYAGVPSFSGEGSEDGHVLIFGFYCRSGQLP